MLGMGMWVELWIEARRSGRSALDVVSAETDD